MEAVNEVSDFPMRQQNAGGFQQHFFFSFFVGKTNRIIITGLFVVRKQNKDENERYVLRPQSLRTVPKNSCGVPAFVSPPDTAAAKRGQVVLIFFFSFHLSQLISNVIRSTAIWPHY